MLVSLDKIDLIILERLLQDGRTSYSAIAKETNLTDVAIKKRVESLKKKGIIDKISCELNLEVLGFENPVFVQIRSVLSKSKDIIKRLESFDYVIELYQVLGEYNLLAKIMLPDLGFAEKFLARIGSIDGVSDVKTMVVLNKLKKSNMLPTAALQKRL